jgi:hypothetical protein
MRTINLHISKNSIGNLFSENLRLQDNSEPRPAEKPYWEMFIETFFNSEYEFYTPVFDYVTGGNSFEVKPLLNDLKHQFDDRAKKSKPQDEVFQKLGNPQVFDLTNEDYIRLTDKMISYAFKGAYPLAWYMAVLIYTQRFPAIKMYLKPQLAYDLIDYVKANPGKFIHDDGLGDSFEDKTRYKDDEEYQDLWRALNEVNNTLLESQIERNRANLFIEFKNAPDDFYFKAKEMREVPIFSSWDFDSFYKYFDQMPASGIPRFRRFLKERYKYMIKEKMEYYFLSALFDNIQKINPEEPKTLRRIALDQLADVLKEIIEKNAVMKTTKH